MIHLFYGEDRLTSEKMAKKILGENYENVDAENLEVTDLPTIFLGTSLFDSGSRKILIKGLAEKKELFEEVEKYLETPHEIVILENKINGNWTSLKNLKKSKKLDLVENKIPEDKEKRNLAFNVFDLAMRNPEKAVENLRKSESEIDAYATLGAWGYKALENLKKNTSSRKNREIVKELAKIDVLLKTTKYSEKPWPVLESFLLRLKNF